MTDALARLGQAERILAESTDLKELRNLHDVAAAAQAYARAHQIGVDSEKHAFIIKTRAGIRLAELCPPMPPAEGEAGGRRQGGPCLFAPRTSRTTSAGTTPQRIRSANTLRHLCRHHADEPQTAFSRREQAVPPSASG